MWMAKSAMLVKVANDTRDINHPQRSLTDKVVRMGLGGAAAYGGAHYGSRLGAHIGSSAMRQHAPEAYTAIRQGTYKGNPLKVVGAKRFTGGAVAGLLGGAMLANYGARKILDHVEKDRRY